jgi:hypothetical protein
MKGDEITVKIIGVEDEQEFSETLAKAQVEAAMRMCPKELRLKVLDNALKILKGESEIAQ